MEGDLKQRALGLLLILIAQLAWAMETVVEVIPVQNRPASEIQPILLPLLDPSDQVVVNGQNLIVKTLPERVAYLKNLVRQLDNPVNNLVITVIQSRDITAAELNGGIQGSVRFPANGPAVRGQARGYFNQYEGRSNIQNTQTIRTMEGVPAHIKVGNAYPVVTETYPGYPVPGQTSFVEATTGFAVTPRLAGDQAVIDVAPWSNRLNENGQFEVQNTETTIRAHLGEWVEIGSVDESGQGQGSGVTSFNNSSAQSRTKILLKIEKAY